MLSFIEAGDSRSPTRPRVYIGIKVFFPHFRFSFSIPSSVPHRSLDSRRDGLGGWGVSRLAFSRSFDRGLSTHFLFESTFTPTETTFLFFSGVPFPRLHMRVPWTHLGERWQSEFLYWPYTLDMTLPTRELFDSNHIRFFLALPLSSFI